MGELIPAFDTPRYAVHADLDCAMNAVFRQRRLESKSAYVRSSGQPHPKTFPDPIPGSLTQ